MSFIQRYQTEPRIYHCSRDSAFVLKGNQYPENWSSTYEIISDDPFLWKTKVWVQYILTQTNWCPAKCGAFFDNSVSLKTLIIARDKRLWPAGLDGFLTYRFLPGPADYRWNCCPITLLPRSDPAAGGRIHMIIAFSTEAWPRHSGPCNSQYMMIYIGILEINIHRKNPGSVGA